MKLSKLPKEKRNHLVLVGLVTLTLLSGLGFGLIKFQFRNLASLAERKSAADAKLHKMREGIKYLDRLQGDLSQAKQKLAKQETGMASGDRYAWVIRTLGEFKARYRDKIDIPKVNPSGDPVDVNLLPKFPYKQATFTVAGTAYYHDLGQFIADFENAHPLIRVVNLDIDQAGSASLKGEKLAFRLDIVALVNPNPS